MIDKQTEKKVGNAFLLLKKYGIYCFVPGCFDITSAEHAALFAKDKAAFYRIVDPDEE